MYKITAALISFIMLSGFGYPVTEFNVMVDADGNQTFVYVYQKKHAKFKDRILSMKIGEAKICSYGWTIDSSDDKKVRGYVIEEGTCKPKPKD